MPAVVDLRTVTVTVVTVLTVTTMATSLELLDSQLGFGGWYGLKPFPPALAMTPDDATAAPGREGASLQPPNPKPRQWWRNAKIGGSAMTLDVHHSWRPSTSENNFLSRNLAEPVADAPLCCARAPAHRHVAPRRPGSELFTWRRLRCPKGSCIGKRGEGRWWVRPPAHSRTSFSKRQKDYRKFGTDFR